MFSALFGNFIFGRASSVTTLVEAEKPEQAEVSTQTPTEESVENVAPQLNASTQSADWVIVERGEEENLMIRSETKETDMEAAEKVEKTAEEENIWLGSFFERNEKDTEEMETEEEKPKQWEITPLPCLTSITDASQQRSMLTTDPLENLLIEHPSMSVFVAKSEIETDDEDVDYDDEVEENVLMHLFDPCYEAEFKKQDVIVTRNVSKSSRKRLNKQKAVQKIKQQQQQKENQKPITTFTIAAETTTPKPIMTTSIKRKETEVESTPSSHSPSPSRKKETKKSKKNAATVDVVSATSPLGAAPQPSLVNNKENKAMLAAELKSKHARKQQQHEINMQLKRANRQALAQKNVTNARNRKYHRLNQPAAAVFFAPTQQF